MKICLGYMALKSKMAAMPIDGKNFKNISLQNKNSDDLETWHGASGRGLIVYKVGINKKR